eukprot:11866284-Karenia_brevis.AAC.1
MASPQEEAICSCNSPSHPSFFDDAYGAGARAGIGSGACAGATAGADATAGAGAATEKIYM